MLKLNAIAGEESNYVSFGDVARNLLGMQCQYASRYVDGQCDEANLTSNLELGPALRIAGNSDDYHGYLIHRDDVEEFVRRVKTHRANNRTLTLLAISQDTGVQALQVSTQDDNPHTKLCRLAEIFLEARYPEVSEKLKAGPPGAHHNWVNTFVMDILWQHKFPVVLHRLPIDKQKKLIGGIEELLLEDLSEDLLAHYGESYLRASN